MSPTGKGVILAVDQGTTGTTVLVMDRRARLVSSAYAELPQHYPRPGWVEHRPQEILRVTWSVIRRALADGRVSGRRVQAVGITNQRETTIVWDRRTGWPIANAIVWQCRRTAGLCDRLKRRGAEPAVRRKTGLVLDAYFSGTKIRWLLDHVPGARRLSQRGSLAFGTVDSWLIWHLTGGRVHATDETNASRTLLYNIRTGRWDLSLARLFGVPGSLLPRVLPSSASFGRTTAAGPLPAGIPITGVAGDQQASMVGHGCLSPGTAKNTYGTGCFLLLHTGSRLVPSRHGLLTTRVYSGTGRPAYALEGSVFIAGAAIQWLRDELGLIRRASETDAIARAVPDTGGVYVVPAFVGLGAPYWDMGARGAIIGLTRGSDRRILVRATLESLAYQTRDVVEAMARDSRIRLRALRVDGGAARNDWLMQFQADLLGIPVVRPASVANTGRGAALLAGIGIGWWTPRDLERFVGRPERTFHPRMRPSERARRYAGWQAAVARVRSGAGG
ncbi:MAG: glycerol kinase GlpK [Candidatus Omnitrophica bacterium]|nr:glycerol kinase GlpK [Candidatus Omnitrophota bacterium]